MKWKWNVRTGAKTLVDTPSSSSRWVEKGGRPGGSWNVGGEQVKVEKLSCHSLLHQSSMFVPVQWDSLAGTTVSFVFCTYINLHNFFLPSHLHTHIYNSPSENALTSTLCAIRGRRRGSNVCVRLRACLLRRKVHAVARWRPRLFHCSRYA